MKFGIEHFPKGTVFEATGAVTKRKSKFTAIGCYSIDGLLCVKLNSTLSRKQRENFPNIKNRWLNDDLIEIGHVTNIIKRGEGKTSVDFYRPGFNHSGIRVGGKITSYFAIDLITRIIQHKMALPKDLDIDYRLKWSEFIDYLIKHGVIKIIEFDLDTSWILFKTSYAVEMASANTKRLEKAIKQNFNRFLKPKKEQVKNTMKMLNAEDEVSYSIAC